jgi:hypothetical protein
MVASKIGSVGFNRNELGEVWIMSKLFNHEGCRSGQCAYQQSVMARCVADDTSDTKNHIEEKRRDREALGEVRRLMNEQKTHTEMARHAD